MCAFIGKGQGHGTTNSTVSASNQDDLILELFNTRIEGHTFRLGVHLIFLAWLLGLLLRGNVFSFFLCRSEEHTSELQSRENLVCRLLLEKKKKSSFAL